MRVAASGSTTYRTGKRLFCRALWQKSPRTWRPRFKRPVRSLRRRDSQRHNSNRLQPAPQLSYFSTARKLGRIVRQMGAENGRLTMSRYVLPVPPDDQSKFKERLLYCWAAGLASFLNVTKLGIVGYQDTVAATGGYMNQDGSIPETGGTPVDQNGVAIPGPTSGGIGTVFMLYNVYSTNISCSAFNYQYVSNILQSKGH